MCQTIYRQIITEKIRHSEIEGLMASSVFIGRKYGSKEFKKEGSNSLF